jgi:hypothetical protein
MSDSALTMFIPFGAGYGNPGLTVRADTVDELVSVFAELSENSDANDPESPSKLDGILDGVAVVNAGVLLKGLSVAKPEPAAKPVSHPQAQSSPADAPTCAHGSMKWKEGVSAKGNNYKGWFCAAPYGQTKCAAQFIK